MRRFLAFYYLATPAFLVLDLVLGVNVRTAFLGGSSWRFGYYALSLGCGWLAWRRPALGPPVGMVESGVNVALLIVGIYLPVINAETALEGGAVPAVLTPLGLTNAALSGLVFAGSFYANQAALVGRRYRR